MRDPAKVFTESGLAEYNARLWMIEDAVSYFIRQADDLHLDDRFLSQLYEMQEQLVGANLLVLQKGDGEEDED